ncbi:MAG: hydrogenase maturation protease [Candidatus Korobacteraceae bacterium]
MRQILVIGYGNPLRGDDGFGGLAASYVEERQIPGLEVIISHQLNPELTELLHNCSHAIFLDAVAGDEPGTLRATPVEHCDLSSSGMHHFEPGSLLALSQAIFGQSPPATLITATARSFHHGDEISPEVRQAAATAAETIASLAASGNLDSEILSTTLRKLR